MYSGIGNVMAKTGMVDIHSMRFGSVLKMLSQKKLPENVRVPRMLADEVLHVALGNNNLGEVLDDLSNKQLEESTLFITHHMSSMEWHNFMDKNGHKRHLNVIMVMDIASGIIGIILQ